MAAKKTASGRREWSKTDIQTLKRMIREKAAARAIGRELKRTEGAIRQKAHSMSLAFKTIRRKTASGKTSARTRTRTSTSARASTPRASVS
jgi:hypothetical protein